MTEDEMRETALGYANARAPLPRYDPAIVACALFMLTAITTTLAGASPQGTTLVTLATTGIGYAGARWQEKAHWKAYEARLSLLRRDYGAGVSPEI